MKPLLQRSADIIGLLGLGLIVFGVYRISPPAACIIAGGLLVGLYVVIELGFVGGNHDSR
jgi:uncharacterized membrane protein HdeD (DUF308 family)